MSVQTAYGLAGAGAGAKLGSNFGPVGTIAGGVIGGLAGLANAQGSMTGASKQALAEQLALTEAGVPPVRLGHDTTQLVAQRRAALVALQPRIQQILNDPGFNAHPLTFAQVQSVPIRPATQAMLNSSPSSAATYGTGTGGSSSSLNLPAGSGGGSNDNAGLTLGGLALGASALGSTLGGSGGSGGGVSGTSGTGGGGDTSTAFDAGGALNTLLGAAGTINSAAASQRQGALLNDALAAYNANWTQGKGIRLAPHPVDLSQTFADPSNPFYSPSAGAVPTVGANGMPLSTPSPLTGGAPGPAPTGAGGAPTALPGVPPLQTGESPLSAIVAKLRAQQATPPGPTVSPLNQIAQRMQGGSLPGVPPLNFGGPRGALPMPYPGGPSNGQVPTGALPMLSPRLPGQGFDPTRTAL